MADEIAIASPEVGPVASTSAQKRRARLYPRLNQRRELAWLALRRSSKQSRSEKNVEVVSEEVTEHPRSADANAEPVEDTNKVGKVEILVPIEKVGWILGKAGEPIRNIFERSRAGIMMFQSNPFDGEQKTEWICRITGNEKQMKSASEMVNDILNQPVEAPYQGPAPQQQYPYAPSGPVQKTYPNPPYGSAPLFFLPTCQTVMNISLSSGFSEPLAPQWGSHPPFSYSHGYNEAKDDNHAPPQHYGPQPTPYAQGGPTTHSGDGPPQDKYNMQQPQGAPPHAQPYGQHPSMPNQPVEVPYQGPTPQQQYPFAPSGPVQQTYPNPPYGSAPLFFLPTWQQAYLLVPVYPAAYGGYGGRSRSSRSSSRSS